MHPSYDILMWSPSTLAFTTESVAPQNHDEAAWLKLRDSSILYIGIGSTQTTRYIPQTNSWINDANTSQNIYDQYGGECGPAFILPNRKAVFFGGAQYNVFYTPTNTRTAGSWSNAASFPKIGTTYVGCPDAPGAMMTNGHILLAVSPIGLSNNDEYRTPTWFLEYDYTTNAFTQITSNVPTWGADSLPGVVSQQCEFLDLPDGNVLVGVGQTPSSTQYFIYTPGSGPLAIGKPTISNITELSCNNFKITGKGFNGICEGAGFGDDWQMSTNYPIVRLTNGTDVYYAKTTNWNRLGAIETDSLKDTAYFTLPNMPGGTYSLVVTANGNPSNPTLFTVYGTAITAHNNNHCYGNNVGSATVTAAGGAGPYTYSWAPGGNTNATASGLSSATYTVTVTDHNGCASTQTVVIAGGAKLVATANINVQVSCHGGNTGHASSGVSGGTAPYTYSWSGGAGSNSVAANLTAGTYTVTVSDSCGNVATASVNITQPSALIVRTDSMDAVSGCNGVAAVTASGGTPGYAYHWVTGGQTTDTIKGQCAGNYCCVVTDAHGCTQTACITIITGIDNIQYGQGQVLIYPNPNNGEFTISLTHPEQVSGAQTIEIYNVLGEKVYSQLSTFKSQLSIDLTNKPEGVYLYRVIANNGNILGEGKLVIQK